MDRRTFIATAASTAVIGVSRYKSAFADTDKELEKPAIPKRVLGKTGVLVSALTIGGVVAMTLLVGLLASWAPAQRATRADPLVAMRRG